MKSLICSVLLLISMATTAQAYFVAIPEGQFVDANKRVRILVSGRGTDLSEEPQKSALTRAQLYKLNFPDEQIVLMSVFENATNEARLASKGWVFIVKNDQKFETNSISKEILKYNKIRSLEFFGHNSPSLGTQADGLGFRYDFRQPIVKSIAGHFDVNAYAVIYGCNSGWINAQELSKKWHIAVAGSFTGTRFERLHSDGHFYVEQDNRYPNNKWATINPDLNVKCSDGGCLRMRPMFSHYAGKWGDFQGPMLSHYKYFCELAPRDCEKSMALSLYGYVAEKSLRSNSSFAEFSQVAKEWLCPVYVDRTKVNDCYKQLAEIEAGRGNMMISYVVNDDQLSCNLQSCQAVMTCDDHSCNISERSSKNSTTLAQEYLHLLNGFRALQADGM
ncbi:hypothetical protein [Bdellovibrio sp. HCB274]|uniref:hypothetical protein n=1 Tax=Bdellovibrio sp. HCB274 TaxID=3394361 RepID=UPI0039B4C4C5